MEPGSLVASGALRARGGCLRPLCRNFARGFCRWGQSCRFLHDRKSAHNCRYFQSGFCSYGDRCGHAYCVGCIRKWRRSRDFQSTVIKACPECRVTSSYYIPNKYWISDAGEKKQLIETFRARTGKIRCKFFVQNQGHCPFNSECLYLHELPPNQLPQRRQQPPSMTVELGRAPLESPDEEDEMFCMHEWALTLTLTETGFQRSIYGPELLVINLDSD
ncbi:unnamed protein product [Bubo scandiacus]